MPFDCKIEEKEISLLTYSAMRKKKHSRHSTDSIQGLCRSPSSKVEIWSGVNSWEVEGGALVTQLGCHRLCVSASVRSGHYNVEQLSGPKQRICTVQLPRRRRMQMVTLCWYHWCVWKWPKTRTSISLFWHFAAFKERLNWQPIKTKFQYFLTTNGVSCKEFRWEKHLVWVVKVCKAYRYDGRKNRTVLTHLHIPNSFTFGLPV